MPERVRKTAERQRKQTMRRRTVQVTAKVDNSLKEKVEAIKAEGYGRLTIIIEDAIKNYNPEAK